MKDTTKIGIYFLIGVIMLVVPITYTLTAMANNWVLSNLMKWKKYYILLTKH